MDDIVKQAMAKWPNVPHCYGWLGLDARGHWYLRDDGAQAQGTFTSGTPGAKGSLLQHVKLIEFIHRNYAADALGQWFFQNGPQRVYVELEVTPWIWRVSDDASLTAQTGQTASYVQCMTDEIDRVFVLTSLGIGMVHSSDVPIVAQILDSGVWSLEAVDGTALSDRYRYVVSPELQHKRLSTTKLPVK